MGSDALAGCTAATPGSDDITCDASPPNPLVGSFFAGAGNDTILLDDGTITEEVFGQEGDDSITLDGTSVGLRIQGNVGNDTITLVSGTVFDDVLGQEGDDSIQITGGFLNDNAFGGAGEDTITVSGTATVGNVNSGADDDTITMSGGTIDAGIEGAGGSDQITLTGGLVGSSVDGDAGDDTIDLNGGTVGTFGNGGDGNDQITLDGAAVAGIIGADGDDTIQLDSGTTTGGAQGNDGDDLITLDGASAGQPIIGGAGADTIRLNGGTVAADVFGGASGPAADAGDSLVLSGASVGGSLFGGFGEDTIEISSGTVTNVAGEDDNDTIAMTGGSVAGVLFGNAGDDLIAISDGTVGDGVSGDDGNDTITMSGGTVDEHLDGWIGDDVITLSGGSVSGNLFGFDGADSITISGGTAGGIDGESGDDTLALTGGTVGGDAEGGDGADVITLDGTDVAGTISGDEDDDDIRLMSGSVSGVEGGTGDDIVRVFGLSSGGAFDDPALVGIAEMHGGDDDDAALFVGVDGTMPAVFDGFETVALFGTTLEAHAPGNDDRDLTDVDLFLVSATSSFVANGNSAGTTTIGGDYANAGFLEMRDFTPGDGADDVVTVQGDYAGAGAGVLGLDVAFDATELADLLVIEGSVADVSGTIPGAVPGDPDIALNVPAGPTFIVTEDVGNGKGAFTGDGAGNGIAVVDVSNTGGTADGDFLLSDGVTDIDFIDVGVFRYELDLEADGIWYLQSFPIAGPYGDIPASMLQSGRTVMNTLWERTGERRNVISEDLWRGGPRTTDSLTGPWLRVVGSSATAEMDREIGGASFPGSFEQDTGVVRAGFDLQLLSGEAGTLAAGVTGHYGSSSLDADDDFLGPLGSIDSDFYGVGANATWYGSYGIYADLVGQASWYELDTDNALTGATGSTDGFGYGVGLEVGYEVAVTESVSVVPQAQLDWQDVDFDSFTDSEGVEVSFDEGQSLEGRLGAAVRGRMVGPGGEFLVTGQFEASLVHEFLGDGAVTVAGQPVSYELDGTGAEVGAGVSVTSWGGISAFGEVDYRTPFDGDGIEEIAGTVGVRVNF